MESTLLKQVIQSKIKESNEKNRYPVPDPNKIMINDTKEHINTHKYTFKEEIL
jgi:hypothetical protein